MIIKNCPAIATGYNDKDYICNTHQMGCGHCKDCTDCLLKRIVEKCREDWEDSTVLKFQRELLDMLDIEECE